MKVLVVINGLEAMCDGMRALCRSVVPDRV
jgi:hypothetical protein